MSAQAAKAAQTISARFLSWLQLIIDQKQALLTVEASEASRKRENLPLAIAEELRLRDITTETPLNTVFQKIEDLSNKQGDTEIYRLIRTDLLPQWRNYRILITTQAAPFFQANYHASANFKKDWINAITFVNLWNPVWQQYMGTPPPALDLLKQVADYMQSFKQSAQEIRQAAQIAKRVNRSGIHGIEMQTLKQILTDTTHLLATSNQQWHEAVDKAHSKYNESTLEIETYRQEIERIKTTLDRVNKQGKFLSQQYLNLAFSKEAYFQDVISQLITLNQRSIEFAKAGHDISYGKAAWAEMCTAADKFEKMGNNWLDGLLSGDTNSEFKGFIQMMQSELVRTQFACLQIQQNPGASPLADRSAELQKKFADIRQKVARLDAFMYVQRHTGTILSDTPPDWAEIRNIIQTEQQNHTAFTKLGGLYKAFATRFSEDWDIGKRKWLIDPTMAQAVDQAIVTRSQEQAELTQKMQQAQEKRTADLQVALQMIASANINPVSHRDIALPADMINNPDPTVGWRAWLYSRANEKEWVKTQDPQYLQKFNQQPTVQNILEELLYYLQVCYRQAIRVIWSGKVGSDEMDTTST